MRKEQGFTLIEVLTTLALAAILMTIGASSLRHYWLVQGLRTAQGDVSSELINLQQQAVSESNPVVFGAGFRPGTSSWFTFRYNLGTSASSSTDDNCAQRANHQLRTGVRILSSTTFLTSPAVSQSVLLSGCAVAETDVVVLFFPKGTATRGHVDLQQPAIGRSNAVCVSPLTARVTKQTVLQAASC